MMNQLTNKTMYGFGDSLVEGHYIGIGMLDALASKHGMNYTKYAKNGATVIPNLFDYRNHPTAVPDVGLQIEGASDTAPDFICFDGLINDAYTAVTDQDIGELSTSYEGIYDVSTFYGAFEKICYLLRHKYQESRILYICVHNMPTRNRQSQELLQEAARRTCIKWSIPYVDVYRRGQINTCVDGMRRAYSYNKPEQLWDGNGTHLNAEGYEKWYLPMIESALMLYS